MRLSKYLNIGILVLSIFFISSCNKRSEFAYKDIRSMGKEAGRSITLTKGKEIILKTGKDIIGAIMVFQGTKDRFLVLDPIFARQCYLFDTNGNLIAKVGRPGEGPQEYLNLLAGCISGDRIFLYGMNKINIYTKDGVFIKNAKKPFNGICNALYEGPNGTFFAVTFNRYNAKKDTIYQLDTEGNVIRSFSPNDNVPKVFDTFFPQGGLCIDGNRIIEFFNYKYEFSTFDFNGNKQKTIELSSPLYTEPDFGDAKKIQGHKAELKYMASFTNVSGLYKHSLGFVSYISNGKNEKESQLILEFWDNDFNRMGYLEVLNPDEMILGVYNDQLVTTDIDKDARLIFWRINL